MGDGERTGRQGWGGDERTRLKVSDEVLLTGGLLVASTYWLFGSCCTFGLTAV